MSSSPVPPPGTPASLRPFAAGLFFAGFNGLTWMIGLGTPMVLLAERLSASAFQVGLASSFVFLLLPVQVLATASLGRLGFKRQMILGWSARALFLGVPLGLAWQAPEPAAPWMAGALVASVFGFCVFRAFGVAAHIPWLAAILPVSVRGRFFATDYTITSSVGVLTLLGCAALFARLSDWDAFGVVYGVAAIGSLLAVASLSRLPSAVAPTAVPVRRLPGAARRLCLAPGPFRFYLGLSLLGHLVPSSLAAFSAYYLKVEAGLPASRILLYTAVQFAGAMAGAWAIRGTLDRLPLRRFFRLAGALHGGVCLFWLALLAHGGALLAALPLAYCAFGVASSLSQAAHHTYLPELAGEAERPLAIAVFTAALGLVAGLAPTVWGLLLRAPGAEPGVATGAFAVYFALGAALAAASFALFGRVRDPRAGIQ